MSEINYSRFCFDKTMTIIIPIISSFLAKLGTHGSQRRRNAAHDSSVKHLSLGEVKRFIGMHNTESIPGKCFYCFNLST